MSDAEIIVAQAQTIEKLSLQLAQARAEIEALKALLTHIQPAPLSPLTTTTPPLSPPATTPKNQTKPVPAFVKPNRSKTKAKARKKRGAAHNHSRQLATPTKVVAHHINHCSTCQAKLGGQILSWSRQIIELPPPPPVEIIEHRIYKGWCSQCQQWQSADPKLAAETVQGSRFGRRIASLISYLRLVLRLPIGLIQQYLASIHQLKNEQRRHCRVVA